MTPRARYCLALGRTDYDHVARAIAGRIRSASGLLEIGSLPRMLSSIANRKLLDVGRLALAASAEAGVPQRIGSPHSGQISTEPSAGRRSFSGSTRTR